MKKVLLHAITTVNFGDDLFIKAVIERYPSVEFVMIAPKVYNTIFTDYENLKIYNTDSYVLKLCRKFKILFFIASNIQLLYLLFLFRFDLFLFVGGSIFMEKNSDGGKYIRRIKYLRDVLFRNMKIAVLGCNFGPYQSNLYLNKIKSTLKGVDDVCFRDEFSYKLFKDIPSVRFGNDIVNHLLFNKVEKKKRIGINLRNVDKWPDLVNYKSQYISKTLQFIQYFADKGYEIVIFSFCEKYGDEVIANELISQVSSSINVRCYNYRGNINEALLLFSSFEYLIATRFHAIILGLILGSKVLPISYSVKTKHTLQMLNIWSEKYEFKAYSCEDVSDLMNSFLTYSCFDKKMNVQFNYADSILK